MYKLDFIQLNQVLFAKKRDLSLEELDRLLLRTSFDDGDKEKIRKYVPRSNWEKYFSALIDEKDHSLEQKWALLYKLRNKVAHNRHVTKKEFEKIQGLSTHIKEIIRKATTKLGEIDLNEEDRELIIQSYKSESPVAIGFLAEKAVAEYYMRAGFEVEGGREQIQLPVDFYAIKNGQRIAVDVKVMRSSMFPPLIRHTIDKFAKYLPTLSALYPGTIIHIVCVLQSMRGENMFWPIGRFVSIANRIKAETGSEVEVHIGRLNEENVYLPFLMEQSSSN